MLKATIIGNKVTNMLTPRIPEDARHTTLRITTQQKGWSQPLTCSSPTFYPTLVYTGVFAREHINITVRRNSLITENEVEVSGMYVVL